MAVKTKQEIANEIQNYILNKGGSYSQWYVGIAAKPRARLFEDHNVDENNNLSIFRECSGSVEARELEKYFIDNLGTSGGDGGGSYNTKYIYAYKKTINTRE